MTTEEEFINYCCLREDVTDDYITMIEQSYQTAIKQGIEPVIY